MSGRVRGAENALATRRVADHLLTERQPLGRRCRSEIAGIAVYLASPAGAYATGQTFVVDGGELVYAPLDNQ